MTADLSPQGEAHPHPPTEQDRGRALRYPENRDGLIRRAVDADDGGAIGVGGSAALAGVERERGAALRAIAKITDVLDGDDWAESRDALMLRNLLAEIDGIAGGFLAEPRQADAATTRLAAAERTAELFVREGVAHHHERMRLRERMWALEDALADVPVDHTRHERRDCRGCAWVAKRDALFAETEAKPTPSATPTPETP